MAYKTLAAVSCATAEEAFQRFRDFLCDRDGTYSYAGSGIGWTLHDAVYAVDEDNLTVNDYIVVHSTGESGDEDMYVRIVWSTSDQLKPYLHTYWDAGTHTGYGDVYINTYYAAQFEDGETLYVYGDLDWFGVEESNLHNAFMAAGVLDYRVHTRHVEDVTNGALTAGSDVTIQMADTTHTEYAVSGYLFIKDTQGSGQFEKIQVKTNNGSNTITADLTNSYSAAAKICSIFPYWMNPRDANFIYTTNGRMLHDWAGNQGGTTFGALSHAENTTALGYQDPSTLTSEYVAMDFVMFDDSDNSYVGHIKGIHCIEDTGLTSLDVLTDRDGNDWRFFATGTRQIIVKEL